jgi:predicted Zn finger-like uncharacterized protein
LSFENTADSSPETAGVKEITMRLTCPNCGAQYEVPDDVIPEEGRDVQCSNCGDTWFQQAAGFAADADADPDFVDTPPADQAAGPSQVQTAPSATPAPPPSSEASAARQDPASTDQPDLADQGTGGRFASEPQPEASTAPDSAAQQVAEAAEASPAERDDPRPSQQAQNTAAADVAEPAPQSSPPQSPARGLDPALGEILREEAKREASLRAADQSQAQTLETQPNLGLDDLPENEEAQRSRQSKDRMARIRGEDPRRLAAEASGLKRGVLPDIEEINSTLRAADSPPPPMSEHMAPAPRKSGFTRGFALAILAVLALVMVYSNAPQIAEILPQADPYLSSYVTWVDQLRLWLDTQVTALQQP